MNTRPKLSGSEFMKKVSPKQTGSIIKFPETKEIFFALIEARGLEVNAGHLRPASDNPAMNEIYAKTARINAIKSSMKIRSNSSDVTDSHYVDVALDAYIKTGGKYENFAGQLELHKKMYRFQNQNESPQFKQPLHVSENRLYA